MAFAGHLRAQTPHRIHSADRGLLTGFTSMGHTLSHAPHKMQRLLSTRRLSRLTLFSNAYIAPNGHSTLQKKRLTSTLPTSTRHRTATLNVKSRATTARSSPCDSNRGIPPSRVPAGQIYLQKAGSPTPAKFLSATGRIKTKTKRITYFMYFANLGRWNLGEGILCSNSCKKPNGHKKPHTARPNTIPNASSSPVT